MTDDWQGEAACSGRAPQGPGGVDLWHDFDDESDGDAVAWEARLICLGCPVRRECLAYAFATEHSITQGVYGGTLPLMRKAYRAHPDRVDILMRMGDAYGERMAPVKAAIQAGVA